MLEQLKRQVVNLVQRGLLTLTDDDKAIQEVQITLRKDQVREGVEHPTNYGFTHHAPNNLDLLSVSQGGLTAKAFVLVIGDRKYRLRGLKKGEVALYDDLGQKVYLTRSGIEIESDQKVTIKTPETEITGNVLIKGNTEIKGNLDVIGKSTLTGLVTVVDKLVSKTLSATVSLLIASKEMKEHQHTNGTRQDGNTGGPI